MDTSTVQASYLRSGSSENGASDTVGQVTIDMIVTNRRDQIMASIGAIDPNDVRQIALKNVLVDTGATTLCLPADLITALGLEFPEEIGLQTASGSARARLFKDVSVSVEGREDSFSCIELPAGRRPLLGVIPCEMLGLEPDLKNRTLKLLPKNDSDSYFMAY
jgi:predicted aspartyl protease